MKIQNLKSGSENYYSCDLLVDSEGIYGYSNVKYLISEMGENATLTNNITYYENKDQFILEGFNKIENTPIIIEKDIFGGQKIWIKDSNYCNSLLDNIKQSKVISVNFLEEVINDSLKNYYKENKLNILILNVLSNPQRKQASKDITPNEMFNIFLDAAIKEDLKFNIDNGYCKVRINDNVFMKIKENVKKKVLNILQIKELLRNKSSSLNDLIVDEIVDHKSKNKSKNKI